MKDVAWLLLHGSDDEVRAAAADPERPKISTAEAVERLTTLISAYGVTCDEFIAAFQPPRDGPAE